MKRVPVPVLLAVCLSVTGGTASAAGVLTVHANEASTQIQPRGQGQQLSKLPPLDVSIVAEFNCAAGTDAESITVSIADTHRHYGREEIADATTFEASLRLPASQIAPISSADFCVLGTPSDEKGLLVPGVASAQVSLRCRDESTLTAHFASVPLPLRLFCATDEYQSSSADK